METKEYFEKAENQRLIVECEIRLAKKKARRDYQNDTLRFLNPEIHTNPYVGESVAMEKEYEAERQLIIKELRK